MTTYHIDLKLLKEFCKGLMLRRINIRQVEGGGFQKVPKKPFTSFKREVRAPIDTSM